MTSTAYDVKAALRKLWRRIRRPLCEHECWPEDIWELAPLGVSLGWSGRPELIRHWRKVCGACGATVETEGYNPFDKTPRDEKDWPLKLDGTPYPIRSYL